MSELITATRVEKHVIKSSCSYFSMLMDFCHKSKNLYNHANYIIRNKFAKENILVSYGELDKILKKDHDYPDYQSMPTAQTAQQTLRLLCKNWKSFFTSIKDWKKHKDKYLGRPKLPKYLKKDGQYILILTNQNCKLQNGKIKFPKTFCGFEITPEFIKNDNAVSFQQVRFLPRRNRIVVEVVYTVAVLEEKPDNNRYIGIDIGVDNLATVCNNISDNAFIINGKPLKSMNKYYNKKISHYREVAKRMNNNDYSLRMHKLTVKRNSKIEDYLHKASRYIVDYCRENNINTIVVGNNKEWKQHADIGRKNNQTFVQIPFTRFIDMIRYKAEEYGVAVIETEESYTSGTSFIDNEEPVKENYNKSRRVHRGLFRANENKLINADLNGAYQILKKVFPIKWDIGCVLHPVVVNLG